MVYETTLARTGLNAFSLRADQPLAESHSVSKPPVARNSRGTFVYLP
jgi:hypothetical protein